MAFGRPAMVDEVTGAFEKNVKIKRQRQVAELLQTMAALGQAREVTEETRGAE